MKTKENPDSTTAAAANSAGNYSVCHEQDVEGEQRFVYYGETHAGRLLALIVTERGERIRVVTAYDLDAGQKRDYRQRRQRGE